MAKWLKENYNLVLILSESKNKLFAVRLPRDIYEWFEEWLKINSAGTNTSERFRNYLEDFKKKPLQSLNENTFDYESWYSDCPFGTYLKRRRKVLCDCTYPSVIKKGRGKGKLIDPEICEACFERVSEINVWLNQQEQKRESQIKETKKPSGWLYNKLLKERGEGLQ